MATASTTIPQLTQPPVAVRPFTVAEYHQMIDAGILGETDAVELLEGWITPKMPRKPPHDAVVSIVQNRVIGPRLPQGWFCRGRSAITTDDSEPEPDVVVARGTEYDILIRHPGPGELALVVEVADASLAYDRTIKARISARAGIPVYWIVNLIDGRLEVFSDPTGPDPDPAYRQRRDLATHEVVPLVVDGTEVARFGVSEIIP